MLQYGHMKNNMTVSLELSEQAIAKLKKTYRQQIQPSSHPYMDALIKIDGCTISIYTSKKVVFQGPLAQEMARLFQVDVPFVAHIGSDEVGTGDYFGPVCVCAAYVDETILEKIQHLPIKDSKLLTDAQVLELTASLKHHVPFSLVVLNNERYNLMHETDNLNQIKAKLHNQALMHLLKKIKQTPLVVVDQFTPPATYFNYLKAEPYVVQNIEFHTQAESKFIGVAIGAILARAAFINSMKTLEDDYDVSLAKGASAQVDDLAVTIVMRHGWPTLDKLAKMHFKNTQRVKARVDELQNQ